MPHKERTLTIRYLFLTMDDELREALAAEVGHTQKAGDAILLTLPNGEHLLIDSGMPHSGPMLQARLEELGVRRIDYVLTTHPHWDHIGGFLTILPEIPVGVFYQSPVVYGESEHFQELQKILSEQKITVKELVEGDCLRLGAVSFNVLNPPRSQIPPKGDPITLPDINNLSLVLRLDYGAFKMLFTGDLYCDQEEVLAKKYGNKLCVDILDVPHHGRATSSSELLIETVAPKVAIISHEDPKQPREERFNRYGIPVITTADHGEILITTNGKTTNIVAGRKNLNLV